MTTKKTTSGNRKNSQRPTDSRAGKKSKSAGFIESTNFKPNWLETGPLTPDMLPDPVAEDDKSQLTQDEFEALQDSLQRFYQEASDEDPDASPPAAPVESGEPLLPIEPTTPVELEIETPEMVSESEFVGDLEPEPAAAMPEPEAWIAPLIERDAGPEPALPPAEVVPQPSWGIPSDDQFVEEENVTADIPPVLTSPAKRQEQSSKTARPQKKKRRDRLSAALLITSLFLLSAAAFVYFVNPFSRIALGAASLARPVTSPTIPDPATGSGAWCLRGDFLTGPGDNPQLIDSGASGDILAEDMIFSLDYPIANPGTYEWQVIDCGNDSLVYPAAPAWVTTTEPDQTVTFNFDSNKRSDPLFFPISYVVSALDDVNEFQVIGNFQDWNPDDTSGRLQRINLGLYQQVRRIARAGSYEGYVIAGDQKNAIDAYGRTTEPIPFSFTTDRNGDFVVFLVDTDRGRASVMYDMPPVLTSLAYGSGNWMLSGALVLVAGLLLLGMVIRWLILHNKRLQMDAGCPNCGRHELMRIARRPADRALHVVGIPAYRYRCRNCIWEGTRLSEEGAAISPGVPLAYFEDI